MTERERELEARVELLQTIIDRVGDGVVACNPEGRWIVWNSAASDTIKKAPADLDPSRWPEHYGLHQDESLQQPFPVDRLPLLRALQGELVDDEQIFLGGTRRWIQVSARRVEDRQGTLRGAVAYYRDITEKRKADEELRRLALIVNASEDAIWGTAMDGRIFSWNPGAEQIFGYPASHALGMPIMKLAPPARLLEICLLRQRLLEGGTVGRFETVGRRCDGKFIPLAMTISPIYGEQGELLGSATIARDLSSAKTTERALLASRERLRLLSARLQSAQEEERRRISRELHDELGQLLTALKIDLAWLEERIPPELEERTLEMSSLLDTTIATVRRIATRLRPQMLEDLGLAAAIDGLARQVCERGDLTYLLTSSLVGHLNPDCALALYRIAQEALTNVVRHSGASRVAISLSLSGGDVILQVEDDGRGITREQLRGRESLGLLGMRERAHLWGGRVEIEPTARGTRVEARIPCARANGRLP